MHILYVYQLYSEYTFVIYKYTVFTCTLDIKEQRHREIILGVLSSKELLAYF